MLYPDNLDYLSYLQDTLSYKHSVIVIDDHKPNEVHVILPDEELECSTVELVEIELRRRVHPQVSVTVSGGPIYHIKHEVPDVPIRKVSWFKRMLRKLMFWRK